MAAPHDDPDDDAPAYDPVVRMPKRMYVPPPEPDPKESAGARMMLAIAGGGALLGATLGALGLAIVWTTLPRVPVPVRVRPVVVQRTSPSDAGAPSAYALDLDASAPGDPPPAAGPRFEVTQQRLGARPLALARRAMHLTPADAQSVVRALQPYVNMRALQLNDRVAVLRDPLTRELRRVEFRRDPTNVWAAVREPEGWHGEHIEVRSTLRTLVAGFRVEASLNASLAMAHLEADMAARLAEVFPAIGLPAQVLEGDLVRLVVEEERLNGQFFRYTRVLAIDYRGGYGHRRAFWVGAGTARGDFFDAQGRTFERGPLHAPVPGARVSSLFNPRRMHPVLHIIKPHNGIDFAAPEGTAIYAAAEGTVASVGPAGPSGNLVTVNHPRLNVTTGYAHMARFAPGLRVGMRVRAGQLVGYVGTTGRSTGPHLHFSTKRNGAFLDPLALMGIRRSIAQEARVMFDGQSAQLARALDRIAIDGATLLEHPDAPGATPDAGSATAPPPPTLPPLEVGPRGVDSETETPEGEGDDPLDEGEQAQ